MSPKTLVAFTDDSSAQTGDKRLFLAGYLHNSEVWDSFSKAWKNELGSWPPIEYFKASEANYLSGEFDHKKGWDNTLRNARLGNLAAIIEHYRPLSFEFSINRKIFEEELKPVSPYGLGRPHFHMCFAVVSGVARYLAEEKIVTPIKFIFDEQQGVDSDAAMFFADMIKNLPSEARDIVDGDPVFGNERDDRYIPLQAADLLVWHLRREREGSISLPLTDKLVCKSGHLVQEIPDELVRKWAKHHASLPGVPLISKKQQWRDLKKEIQRLKAAGIDPSKIKGPGIYYPEGTSLLRRVVDRTLRLVKNS